MLKVGILCSATRMHDVVAQVVRSLCHDPMSLDASSTEYLGELHLLVVDGASVRDRVGVMRELLHHCRASLPLVVVTNELLTIDALPFVNGRRVWFLNPPVDRAALARVIEEGLTDLTDAQPASHELKRSHGVGVGASTRGQELNWEWTDISMRQRAVCGRLLVFLADVATAVPHEQAREAVRARLVRFLADGGLCTLLVLISARALRGLQQGAASLCVPVACRQLHNEIDRLLLHAPPMDSRVAAALERLHVTGRDCGQVRQESIARALGVDPAHLSHLIKRQSGFAFGEWSVGVRMQKALAALKIRSVPVKTVAFESGFGSCAHFDRCFRRLFGLSPSQFRTYCGSDANQEQAHDTSR